MGFVRMIKDGGGGKRPPTLVPFCYKVEAGMRLLAAHHAGAKRMDEDRVFDRERIRSLRRRPREASSSHRRPAGHSFT